MAGITGRRVTAAYARSNTWGTPASVTRQILLSSTEGLDQQIGMVEDDSFNQSWQAPGEAGDYLPIQQEIPMTLRYENVDTWLAAACGSAAAPTVVSSQAANSLVAYSHTVTLATELTQFFTLAVDFAQYVLEVPTFKIRGFSIRVGENGRMMVNFPISGAKAVYDSAVNTNSTVAGAAVASIGNRVFRKFARVRYNATDASTLGATDTATVLREFSIGALRPMADQDVVCNQDYIIEPDDDGFAEFPVEFTFARMNTISANSLARALASIPTYKLEILFTGAYINSTTQRSLKIEAPAMQLASYRAPVTGQGQVRPIAAFKLRSTTTAPQGMTGLTAPLRMTIINANSANLLA